MSSYHGWTHRPHAQGGTDPIDLQAATFPWAIISDGFVETNSGVSYLVGGQYYGTNDTDSSYYTFTQRNTTYPGTGSYDYFTVNVVQRGLYLLDAVMATESWATVTDGWAEFRLGPNKNAWYPFGFGAQEDAYWIDRHVTHDSVNGIVNSFFRINGVASIDSSTEFFPTFKQVSGVNNLVAGWEYFKIVRLQDYEDIADLLTGSVV